MANSLEAAQSALSAGQITEGEYAAVKAAFVKAQQIKSGFDAGLLGASELEAAKKVGGLSVTNGVADLTLEVPTPVASEARPPVAEPAPPPAQEAPPAPAPAPKSAPTSPAAASSPKPQSPKPSGLGELKSSGSIGNTGRSISGVGVDASCVEAFDLLLKKKKNFVVFIINDAGDLVTVESMGDKDSTYDDFLDALPDGTCRYAAYDFEYTNADDCVFNKIVFVMWTPDNSKIKAKMLYASSKDVLKSALNGIALEVQATDIGEIEYDAMHDSVKATLTRK